jgi:hypothetical protein
MKMASAKSWPQDQPMLASYEVADMVAYLKQALSAATALLYILEWSIPDDTEIEIHEKFY